ncbi:MAG: hypothetical protein CVU38_11450 [Chloroflexi bacterium HGW-Chloroflexi-1]|nr:MAG: hypothetical protein CVU38_11450 [Chloroflexi bacterium HGW-Chloroflexi-1]
MTVEDVLIRIRAGLDLEAETEHDLLEEIRGHLEEAVAAGVARGLTPEDALAQAAAAFGVEQAATELQATHAGWGTLEGVAAAALPVALALVLRWLIFAPDGTAVAWREIPVRPALAVIAVVALLVPLLRFPRRRYALGLWIVFWALSLLTAVWPTARW